VWNPAVSSMQVLVDDPSAVRNTIETTTGHDGASTSALHTQLLRASGDFPQTPYYMQDLHPDGDLYFKYWTKLDENLLQHLGPHNWQTVLEWKTSSDYRNVVNIYTDRDGNPYWHVQEDNGANGNEAYRQFWDHDNRDVPVPIGEWFSFETFIHRSAGNDGRIWTAINGQTIADHHGSNMGSEHQAIDRMMLFQNYGGGDKPIGQWIDDVEIWNGMPTHAGVAQAASTVAGTEGHDSFVVTDDTAAHQAGPHSDYHWH
jgi:hypothetical protein